MTPTPEIVAFRRVKESATKGKPWEDTDGCVYPYAAENWKGGYTLERIANPVLLTPEMVEAAKGLHGALTKQLHAFTVRSGEDCRCDICQKMTGLRTAFPSIFNPPKPEPEKTTELIRRANGNVKVDSVEAQILDVVESLDRRLREIEKGK